MYDPQPLAKLRKFLETGKTIVTTHTIATLAGKTIATYVYDINGDGEPEILTSLKDGSVYALSFRGDVLWHFQASQSVFGLYADDFGVDYGRLVAVGSDDCSVYLLGADGRLLWSYKTPGWVSTVILLRDKSTGEALLCAGCDDGSVYGLDITGEVVWRFRSHGKVKRLRVADIDNDGNDEILAISYDKHIYVLDCRGRLKRKLNTRDQAGREFYVADVDKDGAKELVVATFDGYVYLFTATGQMKWRYKTRGKPRTLFAADIDRDHNVEIVVGSEGGFLHILTPRGELKWTEQFATRFFHVDSSYHFTPPRLLLGIEDSLQTLEFKRADEVVMNIRDSFAALGNLEPLKRSLDARSYAILSNVILSNAFPTPLEFRPVTTVTPDGQSLVRGQYHVFVSYVHDDAEAVTKLRTELTGQGVKVWLDREDIYPGERWRRAIRRAITEGAYFIACFSSLYAQRTKTYMNEEIVLAIEELRQRPTDRVWFIPVKLSPCDIPDRDIGAGETLLDLQYVDLYSDWRHGVNRILTTISST
jgi:outer membrane protein assembly factor BamB